MPKFIFFLFFFVFGWGVGWVGEEWVCEERGRSLDSKMGGGGFLVCREGGGGEGGREFGENSDH